MSLNDRLNRLERREPHPENVMTMTAEEWAELFTPYPPGERPSDLLEEYIARAGHGGSCDRLRAAASLPWRDAMTVLRTVRAEDPV